MKNRKSLIISLIIILAIAFTCVCGCDLLSTQNDAKSIVSIEKTYSEGLKDFYTINYSDGSKYVFEITNGKDGVNGINGTNGETLDIESIYNKYVETHPDTTYEEFLKDILDIEVPSASISINKALLSCAKVYTEFTETTVQQGVWPGSSTSVTDTAVYLGSAVVYKVDTEYTYFITNYHVVYDEKANEVDKLPKKIVCYLYGSENFPVKTTQKDQSNCTIYDYGNYGIECEYVGGAITYDIAIIKAKTSDVKAINDKVSPITFAEEYHVGDTAIAIGNSEGEGISVTKGIVSVESEYITLTVDASARSYRSMRIDTAIYHGNSGGGLFNSQGELIGITNAGDGDNQNINYAIPLDIVRPTVESIMHYGNCAKKIRLGVEVTITNSKYVYNESTGKGKIVETLTISGVESNTIAEKLTLQTGDILLAFVIDGVEHELDRTFNIGDLLLTIRSGDQISFKISRQGQMLNTSVYTVLQSDLNVVE